MRRIKEYELNRQRNNLEMIASENIVSKAVMQAQGSVLTLKYAEGYPAKRYYGGCKYVDVVEQLAIDRAKELFEANFANVQPHSGAQANMAVFMACLNAGDKFLGLNLSHGGHLSHGSPVNFSGKLYNIVPYTVDKVTERIDYDALEKQALEVAGMELSDQAAEQEKQAAKLDYIAMMADIDLSDLDDEGEEGMNYAE